MNKKTETPVQPIFNNNEMKETEEIISSAFVAQINSSDYQEEFSCERRIKTIKVWAWLLTQLNSTTKKTD
jgi:hypothetical protein